MAEDREMEATVTEALPTAKRVINMQGFGQTSLQRHEEMIRDKAYGEDGERSIKFLRSVMGPPGIDTEKARDVQYLEPSQDVLQMKSFLASPLLPEGKRYHRVLPGEVNTIFPRKTLVVATASSSASPYSKTGAEWYQCVRPDGSTTGRQLFPNRSPSKDFRGETWGVYGSSAESECRADLPTTQDSWRLHYPAFMKLACMTGTMQAKALTTNLKEFSIFFHQLVKGCSNPGCTNYCCARSPHQHPVINLGTKSRNLNRLATFAVSTMKGRKVEDFLCPSNLQYLKSPYTGADHKTLMDVGTADQMNSRSLDNALFAIPASTLSDTLVTLSKLNAVEDAVEPSQYLWNVMNDDHDITVQALEVFSRVVETNPKLAKGRRCFLLMMLHGIFHSQASCTKFIKNSLEYRAGEGDTTCLDLGVCRVFSICIQRLAYDSAIDFYHLMVPLTASLGQSLIEFSTNGGLQNPKTESVGQGVSDYAMSVYMLARLTLHLYLVRINVKEYAIDDGNTVAGALKSLSTAEYLAVVNAASNMITEDMKDLLRDFQLAQKAAEQYDALLSESSPFDVQTPGLLRVLEFMYNVHRAVVFNVTRGPLDGCMKKLKQVEMFYANVLRVKGSGFVQELSTSCHESPFLQTLIPRIRRLKEQWKAQPDRLPFTTPFSRFTSDEQGGDSNTDASSWLCPTLIDRPFLLHPAVKEIIFSNYVFLDMISAIQGAKHVCAALSDSNLQGIVSNTATRHCEAFGVVSSEAASPMFPITIPRGADPWKVFVESVNTRPYEMRRTMCINLNYNPATSGALPLDYGGPSADFMGLILSNITCEKMLFSADTDVIWFNEKFSSASMEEAVDFRYVGVLMGLSLYNAVFLDLPLPYMLWNYILERERIPMTAVHEYALLDATASRGLWSISEWNEATLSDSCMDFTVMCTATNATVQLADTPNLPVTPENVLEYIDGMSHWMVAGRFASCLEQMKRGFLSVFAKEELSLYSSSEMTNKFLTRDPDYRSILLRHLRFKIQPQRMSFYVAEAWDNREGVWLQEIISDLSDEHLEALLAFITGSKTPPIRTIETQGINVEVETGMNKAPQAHVCFYSINVGRFKDKEMMRKLFEYAMYSLEYGLT